MGYSKITSVEVTNFMVYEHAKMVFDECGIINLKGYNSSGKSSMLKAIGVCLFDLYPKDQAKLIKHGQDYFRIVITFDDGVSIVRDKYSNGQSLYEMYKDGKCILTTKEGRRLSKIDGVPEPIQTYLGLCITSIGCLNYQTRQDPLWLVETTGSDNYASLNEVLRTEEISRASALINSDRNKMNSDITLVESERNATTNARVDAEKYTISLYTALEQKEAYCKALLGRYDAVKRIMDCCDVLGSLQRIPTVNQIDTSRLAAITSIGNLADKASSLKRYPKLETIAVGRLDTLESLEAEASQLAELKGKKAPTVEPITTAGGGKALDSLVSIMSIMQDLASMNAKKKGIKAEVDQVSANLEQLAMQAKEEGIAFTRCSTCGTYVQVEVS